MINWPAIIVVSLISAVISAWLAYLCVKHQQKKLEFFLAKDEKVIQNIKDVSASLKVDSLFHRYLPVIGGLVPHWLTTKGMWQNEYHDVTASMASSRTDIVIYYVRYGNVNITPLNVNIIPKSRFLILSVLFTADGVAEFMQPITTGIPAEIVKRLLVEEYESTVGTINNIDLDSIRVIGQQRYSHNDIGPSYVGTGVANETNRIRTYIERELRHLIIKEKPELAVVTVTAV